MIWLFPGTCFSLMIDDKSDASIWANVYPENIKAMGNTGSTNLNYLWQSMLYISAKIHWIRDKSFWFVDLIIPAMKKSVKVKSMTGNSTSAMSEFRNSLHRMRGSFRKLRGTMTHEQHIIRSNRQVKPRTKDFRLHQPLNIVGTRNYQHSVMVSWLHFVRH